jgi:hypothetical protein
MGLNSLSIRVPEKLFRTLLLNRSRVKTVVRLIHSFSAHIRLYAEGMFGSETFLPNEKSGKLTHI